MAHFGWTWDYLNNGIAWSIVQRMMSDLPSYDYEDEEKEKVKLNRENAQSIMNHINMMI